MNVYLSFNQLINVNTKRSFAATLRRGGIPRGDEATRRGLHLSWLEPILGSILPREIPPLRNVAAKLRFMFTLII